MRSALHALEVIDVAARAARRGLNARHRGTVVVVEREHASLSRLIEISRVARPDDDASHAGLIELSLLKTRSARMPVAVFKVKGSTVRVLLQLRVGRAEHVEDAA